MNRLRRWLLLAATWPSLARPAGDGDGVAPNRVLRFARDHGAHLGARIEWWYATGWIGADAGAPVGFQLTFFRSRTALAESLPGRLAPRQLLFGHAAVTDVRAGRHRHAQRIARWSGAPLSAGASASVDDTMLRLGPWWLERRRVGDAARYSARLSAPDAGFTLELQMQTTQPVLLQGDAGYSRKGPAPHASHYYTQPQLDTRAWIALDGRRIEGRGRAWLDHEWSDTLMPPGAVGWDWIGINLDDGGALTAFVLRAADGGTVYAGGSHRAQGGAVRPFAAGEVRFTARRRWTSPATGAVYPVQWQVVTPVGEFELAALLDAQELDSRASTGAVYWEGLAELRDGAAARVGLGYLEMTGRAAPLRLG